MKSSSLAVFRMIMIENDSCGCAVPAYPCLGDSCLLRHQSTIIAISAMMRLTSYIVLTGWNCARVVCWKDWGCGMNKERAIEVIEDLRDYAYENWDDDAYEEELVEIGKAVDLIKAQLLSSNIVGNAEIEGKKYLIMEVSE